MCFFVLLVLQSTLNKQLLKAAREGKCAEIRRLVKEGANKNCKDEAVREIKIFLLFFNLSLLHLCLFVCFFHYVFIYYQNATFFYVDWLDSTNLGIQ